MARGRTSHPPQTSPLARASLALAGVLFGLFVANVIAGRVLVNLGRLDGTGVPGVAEFLLLFAAVVAFTVSVLARERAAERERAAASTREAA